MLDSNQHHPVEEGTYVIPTNVTEATSQFVMSIVRSSIPGCLLYGRQRVGKSRSLRQIIADLIMAFAGRLVVIRIQAEFYSEKPSEAQHYSHFLSEIDHAMPDAGKASQRKNRFRDAIATRVAASGQRRFVVVIDDAQFLWEHQLFFLMNDFNNFEEKKKIKPTYVLVGQKELAQQRLDFQLAGKQQLVGRFMTRYMEVDGIRNEADMRVILEGYDEGSEYPEDSGISFTRHYFPAAFEAGWRISSISQRIWNRYKAIQRANKIDLRRDILMEYFIPVVEKILKELGDATILAPEIHDQWLEDAIIDCGYVDSERT